MSACWNREPAGKGNAGFTLLELLLSVTLIGIIAGISLPVQQAYFTGTDLSVAAETFAQTLRRAQLMAQGSTGDSEWGVRAGSGSVTLFMGSSYAARDADYDEVYEFATAITPSGDTEYVFAKMTGEPDAAGVTTLASPSSQTRMITVNTEGGVAY